MSNSLYLGLTSLLTLAVCGIIAFVVAVGDMNPWGAFICIGGLIVSIVLRVHAVRP